MTQYLLRKDKEAKELLYALDNYSCVGILIRAFSLGNRQDMIPININLENKHLDFIVSKNWDFYVNNKKIISITPDKNEIFKLEYQDHRNIRLVPDFPDPNDSRMMIPAYSTFRNVVDNYLLEVHFNGKIPLIIDKKIRGVQFYKIKR